MLREARRFVTCGAGRKEITFLFMSPLSLVFSSDEETSRRLGQALHELDLTVEHCPEIFAAVEKLTSRSFEVIVADWKEGLEASFLLKTAHELRANQGAFTIAIASAEAAADARQAGAHIVLSKPLVPDKVKYALLTCDEFLCRLRTWLPNTVGQAHEVVENPWGPPPPPVERHVAERRAAVPSPPPHNRAPVSPAPAPLEGGFLQPSGIQSLFQASEHRPPVRRRTRINHSTFLRGAALGVAFLSVGYVFSQPLRSAGVSASVAKIYERAVEKTHHWLRPSDGDEIEADSEVAQNSDAQSGRPRVRTGQIRVIPVRNVSASGQTTPATQPPEPARPQQVSSATIALQIPGSLRAPIPTAATVRNAASRLSLLGAMEPVSLSEDLAQKLLVDKVQPSYPEQALQAGLQGPVVLQAWISRDGTIRELKLIRGSFLLGQAAYQAVKQWRYKPYLLNGQAVEAQTYVTVDFRLP